MSPSRLPARSWLDSEKSHQACPELIRARRPQGAARAVIPPVAAPVIRCTVKRPRAALVIRSLGGRPTLSGVPSGCEASLSAAEESPTLQRLSSPPAQRRPSSRCSGRPSPVHTPAVLSSCPASRSTPLRASASRLQQPSTPCRGSRHTRCRQSSGCRRRYMRAAQLSPPLSARASGCRPSPQAAAASPAYAAALSHSRAPTSPPVQRLPPAAYGVHPAAALPFRGRAVLPAAAAVTSRAPCYDVRATLSASCRKVVQVGGFFLALRCQDVVRQARGLYVFLPCELYY